jgi:hypothetical protein
VKGSLTQRTADRTLGPCKLYRYVREAAALQAAASKTGANMSASSPSLIGEPRRPGRAICQQEGLPSLPGRHSEIAFTPLRHQSGALRASIQVEPDHFRPMMACAEICRTSAQFMLVNTPHHKHTCAECAEVCEECARDCEHLGDIQECVDACHFRGRDS